MLLYRTELVAEKDKVTTLCAHHKAILVDSFETFQTNYCDPFQAHKQKILKNLHAIYKAITTTPN